VPIIFIKQFSLKSLKLVHCWQSKKITGKPLHFSSKLSSNRRSHNFLSTKLQQPWPKSKLKKLFIIERMSIKNIYHHKKFVGFKLNYEILNFYDYDDSILIVIRYYVTSLFMQSMYILCYFMSSSVSLFITIQYLKFYYMYRLYNK